MSASLDDFAGQLRERIEREYQQRGYSLGWRLLYSPVSVLQGATTAFVGLNPGGSVRPVDHAEFATMGGSAYEVESWDGTSPGNSKLQRQVLALFRMIGEDPATVMAGNLVPFRSPSWASLPNRHDALLFGTELWRQVLARVRPSLIVCMTPHVFDALSGIVGARDGESVKLGWGTISGERRIFQDGVIVRLPHLSRFGVATRAESRAALTRLLRTDSGLR